MEKNKKEFKKIIILIISAILVYWTVNNLSLVGDVFSNIISMVSPFVLGACLAFILNIPMVFFEKKLLATKSKKNKKPKNKKLIRVVSIISSIAVIIVVFALIITLIVPKLIEVINLLIDNIPYYVQEIIRLSETYGGNFDINTLIQKANINIDEMKNQIISKIPTILTSSVSVVTSFISGITTFFIAIIFAIYILIDKEKLQEQSTKILHAYLKKETIEKIINIGKVAKHTFKSFLTVQCLEAIILGALCVIGMLILRIPYAIPIGVLVGVTALIPVVGAFIGCIIGAILIVAVNPIKVVTFIIFFLILQQVEGNLIYPRVVGNSIGLPGMWVLVAVTVGGDLGGVLGMLLGVPVATIMYTLLKKNINEKIDGKVEE